MNLGLILFLSFFTAPFMAAAAEPEGPLTPTCQKFVAGLPENYKWGMVDVPEDWNNPKGKTLKIFYYWNSTATGTPIAYINGGPRKDSHATFVDFQKRKHTDLPLLFFDQRGNGCSDSPDTAISNVSNWTSGAIVRDMEAIRGKVYGETTKWKIFGHSYGTVVAFRYLTVFPGSLAAVFTSSFGMMSDGLQFRMAEGRGQERIYRELYLKKYPDDKRVIGELEKMIPSDMCTKISNYKTSVCGVEQLAALGSFLLENIMWETVHLWVGAVGKQWDPDVPSPVGFDQSALHNLVAENIFWDPEQADQNPLHHGIMYHEVMPGVTPNQGCKLALAQQPATNYFNRCRLWAQVIGDTFTDPDFSSTPPQKVELSDIKKALQTHPNLQVQVFTGDHDFRVPPEMYEEMNGVLKGLPNYTFTLRPGHDHHTFVLDNLLWDTVAK